MKYRTIYTDKDAVSDVLSLDWHWECASSSFTRSQSVSVGLVHTVGWPLVQYSRNVPRCDHVLVRTLHNSHRCHFLTTTTIGNNNSTSLCAVYHNMRTSQWHDKKNISYDCWLLVHRCKQHVIEYFVEAILKLYARRAHGKSQLASLDICRWFSVFMIECYSEHCWLCHRHRVIVVVTMRMHVFHADAELLGQHIVHTASPSLCARHYSFLDAQANRLPFSTVERLLFLFVCCALGE